MKLSSKYNRVTLFTAMAFLLITGIIYYVVIHFILTKQVDKDLDVEEQEIKEYVRTYQQLPVASNFKDQKVEYNLLGSGQSVARRYAYRNYWNKKENEQEPGRSLVTAVKVGGNLYEVTIIKSRVETEDLVRIIFLITVSIIGSLLISLFLINRLLLSRLWRPFYSSLAQMKAFNISSKEEIRPEKTNLDEFNELNQAILSMAERVKKDYKELKNFTDNASHEMMTPLAVINSKLDSLLQTQQISPVQGELLEDIYNAVSRLSRLNQSLILLAKIENNLIRDYEQINLKTLIEQKARHFQELLSAAGLSLQLDLKDKTIVMSKYLADILLNNLFSNAIRHNAENGEIYISLDQNCMQIRNTAAAGALEAGKAFERFYKNSASEGMGLGLALCRQICMLSGLDLQYDYQENRHIFSLYFINNGHA